MSRVDLWGKRIAGAGRQVEGPEVGTCPTEAERGENFFLNFESSSRAKQRFWSFF